MSRVSCQITGSFAAQRALGSAIQSRSFACKAVVCGAAGGIGQPLSMLMKLDPNITELALYDVVPVVKGVAADLSHVNSTCQITGGFTPDNVDDAFKGCNIVVVPAGVPRKPGMTRDDLFNINAKINYDLAMAAAKNCPDAMFLIISNPVNSMVPIWAETLKKAGCYNPKHLMGVTTLDITRANTFVAENQGFSVNDTSVDVIGGHAGTTILPLLSQVPGAKFSQEDLEKLTYRIQFGGDEVVKAKDGAGSATLSMAYAGAEFASLVARAMTGESGIKACAYVESTVVPDTEFFSTPVSLGKDGVEQVHGYGTLSAFEQKGLDEMLPDLKGQIKKGKEFVTNKSLTC